MAAGIEQVTPAYKSTKRRRRRSKWSGYGDPFDTPEYRERVAAEQAVSSPPLEVPIPMGPGLDAHDEAIWLARQPGAFAINLWRVCRERRQPEYDLVDV
jgi:hypothetical protein